MPKLILKHKAEVLKEYSFKDTNFAFTIGSEAGNDVVVPDKLVSMTHSQIERKGDQYFVRDLKSAFGTYVNGTKIDSATELRDGDILQIGDHTLVFKYTLESDADSDEGAKIGQSISSFLTEVKTAVVSAVEGEPDKRQPDTEESLLTPEAIIQTQKTLHAADESRKNFQIGSRDGSSSEKLEIPGAAEGAQATRESSRPRETPGMNEKSPYYLLAIHGPYLGKKYQLNFGETKIGRDSKLNDIVIRQNKKGEIDPSISRRHATITYHQGRFYLTDKRSQSRSCVNQYKLSETDEVVLAPGDEIEIISDQQSTIFRFVAEGNWDFSAPKRAGEWWLRYRTRALNVATAILVLIGLILGIRTWWYRAIITDVPAPFEVEFKTFTKIDYGETLKERPLARSRDLMPAPVLADINGDKEVDILITQPTGVVIAIDGKNRRRLWEANTIVLNRTSPPVAADVNGNGKADIVALTADGHLIAIDGFYGAEIWTSPFFEKEMVGPPIVADFNGDGFADVAAISVEGRLNVGYSQIFNMQWVEVDIGLACSAPLSASDLNDDGDNEILIATDRGIVLMYDGVERRVTTTFDVNEQLGKLKGSLFEDNPIRHPIGVADLNGDRQPDLIITSQTGNLLCVSPAGKKESSATAVRNLWWANLASERKKAPAFPYPFALADLDNDGLADIIALSDDGSVKAFRGRGAPGQQQPELWQTSPDTTDGAAPVWAMPPIPCDFNKDGAVDVVITNAKRELKILNGRNGELLWRDERSLTSSFSMPLLADLFDDTLLDIVILSGEGTVYNFRTNRRVLAGSILWGQKYGTPTNISATTRDPAVGSYNFTLIANSLVMFVVMAGNLLLHQRRRRLAKPR
ncbi:MAG: FHA domain-containing protein [candidate division KSB1 bacterium]|nr:FHA domain-containing protein [candidate division KSB1 bacterium]MDZ7302702.1 FHA domain-containing protein [candidate division KSB1 bacterium]MDZ7311767.1 FHA domain-containing protein [candidate division KSB1 bacterium]